MNEIRPSGEAFLLPRLQRALALAGGTHEWSDVLERLRTGHAQYWQTPDARGALITELLTYPRMRVVNYWLAGGDLNACLSLVPGIEQWAIEQGCVRATGMGRPGFASVLGPSGVSVAGVAYRKELAK